MFYKHRPHVFLGPVCNIGLSKVAGYSSTGAWGVPVISPGGFARQLDDKAEYEVLTRVMGSYSKIWHLMNSVLEKYRWSHVSFMWDFDTSRETVCFQKLLNMYIQFKRDPGIAEYSIPFNEFEPEKKYEEYLKEASKHSRSEYYYYIYLPWCFNGCVCFCDCTFISV